MSINVIAFHFIEEITVKQVSTSTQNEGFVFPNYLVENDLNEISHFCLK